jgi:hypothetical protein
MLKSYAVYCLILQIIQGRVMCDIVRFIFSRSVVLHIEVLLTWLLGVAIVNDLHVVR